MKRGYARRTLRKNLRRWVGARRITNGGRKNIGKFPSLKNGRPVWYESLLERDLMSLLELDPLVIRYKEQPFKILYVLDGKIRTYTPDLLVERRGGTQVIEVKPKKKTLAPDFIRRTRLIAQICATKGYEYVIATEKEIRVEPRLRNIKILRKYARTRLTHNNQIDAFTFFAGKQRVKLSEVASFFKSRGSEIQVVYALIYWGVLSMDLDKPIAPSSAVRLSSTDTSKEKSA